MTGSERPIVVIVDGEVTAVVRSQVPSLLAALRRLEHRVDAALVGRARTFRSRASRRGDRATDDLFASATGVEPVRRTYRRGDRGLEAAGKRLAADLAQRGLASGFLLCRQPRAAVVGIAARDALARQDATGPRVVLQLRGFEDLEYLATLGRAESELVEDEKETLGGLRFREELACRRADGVLAVSRPMERLVLQRYALEPQRVGRVPSHAEPVEDAETLRAASREELGIGAADLVLAWCGNSAAWQMPETAIRIFEGVRALRDDARLLCVTDEVDGVADLLRDRDARRVIVRRGADGEVRRLLAAADYGLLPRADHVVNRTACPVVFGEYLACGARPVLAPHIGDQSELCDVVGLGLVVGLASADLAGRAILQDAARTGVLDAAARERRRAWARENISPARAAVRVAEFLSALPERPLA